MAARQRVAAPNFALIVFMKRKYFSATDTISGNVTKTMPLLQSDPAVEGRRRGVRAAGFALMICLRRKYFSANVTKLGYAIQYYPIPTIWQSRRRTAKKWQKSARGGRRGRGSARGKRRQGESADFCSSFFLSPDRSFPLAFRGNLSIQRKWEMKR